MDISWIFYLITAAVVVVGVAWKGWTFGLLSGYVFLVISVTVLSRVPAESACYELVPFWSYAVPELRAEIVWNVIAFIPLGVLAGLLYKWKGILIGAGLSVFVELTQLVTHRGLFEFDDIIHNTVGTIIGVALAILIAKTKGSDCEGVRSG